MSQLQSNFLQGGHRRREQWFANQSSFEDWKPKSFTSAWHQNKITQAIQFPDNGIFQ
jgi:hypothetical protein